MNFDAHQDKAADFSSIPWIPKALDQKVQRIPTVLPRTEVLYLINREKRLLTPLPATRIELRDGQSYSFRTNFSAVWTEDAVLVSAYAQGGKLHVQLCSCCCSSSQEDGVVLVVINKMIRFWATPLTGKAFLAECEHAIPPDLEFGVFRKAISKGADPTAIANAE